MPRHHIDLKEENYQIEECERKISCHDVPGPDVMALDTAQTKGISQWVAVVLTPPTQYSYPIHICTLSNRVVSNIIFCSMHFPICTKLSSRL